MATARPAVQHLPAARRWRPVIRDVAVAHAATWLVAGLVTITAVAGVLLSGSGGYSADPRVSTALVARDLIALAVAVPALVLSAARARRGSTRALLSWMAALFYLAYSYYGYVVGAAITPLYPVYVAIVAAGLYGTVALIFALDFDAVPAHIAAGFPVRTIGAFLALTGVFFACLWLLLIVADPAEASGGDLLDQAVTSVDGIVLLPLLLFGSRWLSRRDPLGYPLAAILLAKTTGTFLTLVTGTVLARQAGLAVEPALAVAFAAGLGTAAILTIACFRHVRDAA